MKQAKNIVLAALIFLCLGACAHQPETPTARYFAEKGMQAFRDGDYRGAIEAFEKVRDWYPFSKYVVLADLKIADARFELAEYEAAAHDYDAFERLHPRNEAIPFVVYRIGLCHFNQLDTIDRDQTPARQALEIFQRLQTRFPESEYAEKAREIVRQCRQSLAGHELYVGKFYYRTEHYKAAWHRFQTVLSDYEKVGDCQEARRYKRLCEKRMTAGSIAEQEKNVRQKE